MKSDLQEEDTIEGDTVAAPGTEEPVAFEPDPSLETEVRPPSGGTRS
jgi:hypothetical protein